MKKVSFLSILILPMFLIGCISTPHKADSHFMKTEDGRTHVKIQLHDDDPTEIGSLIGAYETKCKPVFRRGNDSESCSFQLIGMGRIIDLNKDVATVEFPSHVAVRPQMSFEASSKM